MEIANMPRPVHFELSADNPERAIKFYEGVFGWKFNKWGGGEVPYWVVETGEGPGIDGGLSKRQQPGSSTRNSISVDSVDEASKKVTAAGGKVVEPKMPIPTVGYVAYCVDTEGNSFGLFQSDPNAKLA
jgi:uncharacterized protein